MSERRIAILIDADNVSYQYASTIIDEANALGMPIIKRAYGDWTQKQLNNWAECCKESAIKMMEAPYNTSGKNSSDIALVIDAMEICYTGGVEGFCIASSDGDFTSLVMRLVELDKFVVGMGMNTTPRSMINACNEFRILDSIFKVSEGSKVVSAKETKVGTQTLDVIVKVIEENSDDNGWLLLTRFKPLIVKQLPDFDERTFGYKKLKPFMESLGHTIEIKCIEDTNNPMGSTLVYVRVRRKKRK